MSISLGNLEEIFNTYKGVFGEIVEAAGDKKVTLEATFYPDGEVRLESREIVETDGKRICNTHKIRESSTLSYSESGSYLM